MLNAINLHISVESDLYNSTLVAGKHSAVVTRTNPVKSPPLPDSGFNVEAEVSNTDHFATV